MARFLVEILINAMGGPKARASFDDVGTSAASASKKVQEASVASERALRRTAEAAERLKDQMEETKASKGLISDLASLNARMGENLRAMREGTLAINLLNKKRHEEALAARIATAQVRAGVAAHSEQGKEINRLIREHDKLQSELRQTQTAQTGMVTEFRAFASIGDSVTRSLSGILAGLISFQAAKSYLTSAVTAIVEADDATAQLRSRLDTFGNVSGMGLGALTTEADRLSHALGIDDEAVIQLMASLAKFHAIDSPALFKRTTMAAIDLAAASTEAGQSIESNFSQMGEALGKLATEPDEALGKLTRMVGSFTDAQEESIKALAESGDEAGALSAVLDILEERVGGTAASLRNTLGGSLRAVSVEWENQKELLSEGISPALREAAAEFTRFLQSADGQAQMVQLGRDLGDVLRSTIPLVQNIAQGFRDVDAGGLIQVVGVLSDMLVLLQGIQKLSPAYWEMKGLGAVGRALQSDGPKKPETFSSPGLWGLQQKDLLKPQDIAPTEKGIAALGEAAKKTGKDHASLGKDMTAARESAQKLLTGLIQEESAQKALTLSAGKSAAAYKEAKLAREQELKVAQIRESYLKSGLKWTAENTAEVYRLVKSLRDLKAQEEALSTARTLMLKVSVDTTELDRVISETAGKQVELDLEWRRSAFQINQQNQDAFTQQRADVQSQLKEQADYFKRSLITPKEEFDTLIRQIDSLASTVDESGQPLLSATEAQRLYTQAVTEYQAAALDFAGSMIAVAQSLSSAGGGSNKWGGALAGLGGVVQSGGYNPVAWYQLFEGIATALTSKGGDHYGARVTGTSSGGAEFGGAWTGVKGQLLEAKKIGKEIASVLDDLIRNLGGYFGNFPTFEIAQRGEGWKVYFEDGMDKMFRTFEEARDWAIIEAVKRSAAGGLSPEVVTALKNSTAETMEEFMAELAAATSAERARIGETGGRALDIYRNYDKEISAAERLKIATDDMVAARDREITSLRNSVLGVDEAVSQRLASISSLASGLTSISASARARLEEQIRDTERLISEMGTGPGTSGHAGHFGKGSQQIWDNEMAKLRKNLDRYLSELARIPRELSAQEKNIAVFFSLYDTYLKGNPKYRAEAVKFERMRVDLAFQLVKAELIKLQMWEQYAGMFADAYRAAMAAAGQAGAGGARGGGYSEKDQVKDFIKDKKFELSLVGLSDYQRALKELDRTYEPLLKSAGKDNALKDELIKLREKERRLIEEQQRKTVAGKFDQFMGIGQDPFSQIRKGAADLVKEIEDSPFGNERKARMIGRILAEVDRQIEKLSRQMAVGLFGELLGDLEKYGASESLMSQARQQMALIEHTLKVEHYRTEIALLRAAGKLGPEVLSSLDAAFAFVAGLDPAAIIAGGGGGVGITQGGRGTGRFQGYDDNVIDGSDRFGDALKRATDLLKKYTDDGLSPLAREFATIREDFTEIIRGLGSTPAVLQAREDAIRRAFTRALGGLQDTYNDLLKGPSSGMTIAGQYGAAEIDYARALNELQSGNYENIDNLDTVVQRLIELGSGQWGTSTGGFQDLRTRLLEELGPVLNGTGINLSQILAGGGSETASQTSALTANNDNNTTRIIGTMQSISQQQASDAATQQAYFRRMADRLDQLASQQSETAFRYGNG